MTAHFNLAVLSNETNINKTLDAKKPEATNLDAELSTSTADEETYIKIPSRHNAANCDPKKQHPTGAVTPTCRREYRLVNGIRQVTRLMTLGTMILLLMSDTHTHTHTHTHTQHSSITCIAHLEQLPA